MTTTLLTLEQVEARLLASEARIQTLEALLAQTATAFQDYQAQHGPAVVDQLRLEMEQLRTRLSRPAPEIRLVDPMSMVPDTFDDAGI